MLESARRLAVCLVLLIAGQLVSVQAVSAHMGHEAPVPVEQDAHLASSFVDAIDSEELVGHSSSHCQASGSCCCTLSSYAGDAMQSVSRCFVAVPIHLPYSHSPIPPVPPPD